MLSRSSSATPRLLALLVGVSLLALAPAPAPATYALGAASAYAEPRLPGTAAPHHNLLFVPRNVAGITASGIITPSVSAGGYHTCGLKGDGHLLCWGNDSSNQIQAPPTTFTQVSSGDTHTCGLKDDGKAACWGQNSTGQSSPPTDTLKLISSGLGHTCGIKTNGTALCWGRGGEGQIAQQTGAFIQISAGGLHSCGIKNDGTAICWGSNIAGRARSRPALSPRSALAPCIPVDYDPTVQSSVGAVEPKARPRLSTAHINKSAPVQSTPAD